MSSIVGLDVGGANLKAACWQGLFDARAAAQPFAMWKQHQQLGTATRELLHQLIGTVDNPVELAVTMTGELADCFASRGDGVGTILQQLCQVAPPERIHVYGVDGMFYSPHQAMADPWRVAASNWHALANWLAHWPITQSLCQQALVVDIGSTTVDIIPLINGSVATDARTDRDRLQRRQLVYTGMQRTPVCAVVQQLELDGQMVPVMAELFATVDDAWLVLGLVSPEPEDCNTADGRPRTAIFAQARLARMIGEDRQRLTTHQLTQLSRQIVGRQSLQIAQAIDWNLTNNSAYSDEWLLFCSGHGLPLWEQAVRTIKKRCQERLLTEFLNPEVSRSAPAAATAWLYQNYAGSSERASGQNYSGTRPGLDDA